MGDILHALPAVTALRLAHPDWQIGWVVEPRWQPLLKAGNGKQGPGDQGNKGTRALGSEIDLISLRNAGSQLRNARC